MSGVAGHSVVLPCDLPVGSRRRASVQWIDYVYNTGPQPELISTGRRLHRAHPNTDNFHVDSDLTLTISALQVTTHQGRF